MPPVDSRQFCVSLAGPQGNACQFVSVRESPEKQTFLLRSEGLPQCEPSSPSVHLWRVQNKKAPRDTHSSSSFLRLMSFHSDLNGATILSDLLHAGGGPSQPT